MSKISQKDYLKKYLTSDDKHKKKKKKSKDKNKVSTVKIIDDDDYGGYQDIDEGELFATNEEAPQIVGVIDERAPDVFMTQEYIESGKWKKIGEDSKAKSDKLKTQSRRSQSSDLSPPRDAQSPSRKRDHSPDNSPPRKRKNSSDQSPPRKRNENLPSGRSRSPARRFKGQRRDSDTSPPRRAKRRDSDNTPPRQSLQRNGNKRRDSDASPPRRSRKSPERSRKRRDSPDFSPPRRTIKQERNNSSDEPRRYANRRVSNDMSPPRKQRRSPEIILKREPSPCPYQRTSVSPPPRRRRSRWSPDVKREPESPKRVVESPPRSSRMTKTLDGKASGLQDAKTLKRENDEHKARQDKLFHEMRPEVSGRHADVVIRDRRGRNKEFELDVEAERQKAELEEARKKEYDKWGKGLKQIEDLEKRYQEHMHEASKPLARMADDQDLQDHLRDQERLDDPMLQYMRKKKDEESRKKGVEVKPKYLGQFPDNRFNIRPGYRWDGVDRSNGYEKKYFSMINSKKSMEEEAYRYATEDM